MSIKSKQLDHQTSIIFKNIKFIVFDFDGVFTDNSVYITQDGKEMVKCSRYDGIGLKNLETMNGVQCFLIAIDGLAKSNMNSFWSCGNQKINQN